MGKERTSHFNMSNETSYRINLMALTWLHHLTSTQRMKREREKKTHYNHQKERKQVFLLLPCVWIVSFSVVSHVSWRVAASSRGTSVTASKITLRGAIDTLTILCQAKNLSPKKITWWGPNQENDFPAGWPPQNLGCTYFMIILFHRRRLSSFSFTHTRHNTLKNNGLWNEGRPAGRCWWWKREAHTR